MSDSLSLAIAHLKKQEFLAAEILLKQLLEQEPNHADALHFLGVVAAQQEYNELALKYMKQALQLNPHAAAYHINLGNVLKEIGEIKEAIASYEKALQLQPHNPENYLVYNNLGVCFSREEMSDLDKATEYFQQALQLHPNYAEAYNNLGSLAKQQENFKQAMHYLQKAIQLAPQFKEAYYNLAGLFLNQGQADKSVACYYKILNFLPEDAEVHCSLAATLLSTGQFTRGWHEYAWRINRREYGALAAEVKRVPPLSDNLSKKRLFLVREQGIGDTLFFLRFAPLLKAKGAWLSHSAYCKVLPLLQKQPWLDQLLGEHDSQPKVDYQLLVGHLPLVLNIDHPNKVMPALELCPLPHHLSAMREKISQLGPPPYIGLTWWAGTPKKKVKLAPEVVGLYKEIPLVELATALAKVKGTILVLQRAPKSEEIQTLAEILQRPVHDFSHYNNDLEAMLAVLFYMDEYIGVSNTNMHLLAGIGKTARVLMPYPAEWRWLFTGEESPWFKGFKIYRQSSKEEWGPALQTLVHDLKTLG